MNKQDILQIISDDKWMMQVLQIASKMQLPNWYISAGFIRTKVWNTLSNIDTILPSDIDLIFYDSHDVSIAREQKIEDILLAYDLSPSVTWEVRNQARMHEKNEDNPYVSIKDALCYYPEVCTAVAVTLNNAGDIEFLAPFGIEDLVAMIVRPTPAFLESEQKMAAYQKRRETKQWDKKWNKVSYR